MEAEDGRNLRRPLDRDRLRFLLGALRRDTPRGRQQARPETLERRFPERVSGMRPLRCAGWLLLGALGACRREPAPDRSGPPPVASSPPGTVSAASRAAVPEAAFRWPATERVVAVGDLHGDLAAT